MKLSIAVSTIAILVAASCSRIPLEDQNSPSGKSGNAGRNSNLTAEPDRPSTVSADTKAASRHTSVGHFWGSDLDLNSGDTRAVLPAADGSRRDGIYETELSKEVRRLGIPIADGRKWVPITDRRAGSMELHSAYSSLPRMVDELLELFDQVKATDEERRDVLERLMTSLRTDRPPGAFEEVCWLIVEVSDRHGMASPFTPDFTEHLRKSRVKQLQ
jgi:hypothetical protein